MREVGAIKKLISKKKYLAVSALGLLVFCTYLATWNRSFVGYEPDTVEAAIALTKGKFLLKKPGIGASLFYIPFVYLGYIVAGQSLEKFLTIVPVFYSALAIVVAYFVALELGVKQKIALLGSVALAFGSLIWPYSRIGMEYQTTLLALLLLFMLLRYQKKLLSPFVLGFILLLLVLSKSYGVLFCIPATVFLLFPFNKERWRSFFKPQQLFSIFGPPVLALGLSIFFNYLFKGRISGAYGLSFEFTIIHWWEGVFGTFFGAGKSIFIYNPLLIWTAFLFPLFYKKQPKTALFILTSFGVLFLITAPFRFWSDETLSVRKLVPGIVLLHLPLFYGIERIVEKRNRIRIILLSLLICCSFMVQFLNSLYPYGRYLIFLRAGNMDTFLHLRYNPAASPLYINARLFWSYVSRHAFGSRSRYDFIDKTWMRCCLPPKSEDVAMIDYHADLSKYDTPSSYIITAENKTIRLYFALFEISVIVLSAAILYLFVRFEREDEQYVQS